jgi:flagellar biosynthesis/type III secretory pathway M-ring protein FliF/YscJ
LLAVTGVVIFAGKSPQREFLFNGRTFAPSELAAAEIAFAKAELFDYEFVARKIRVPRASRAEYIKAIAEAGALPADFDRESTIGDDSSHLFETRAQRQLRRQAELERKLAQAITHLGGIDKATVRFDERSSGGLKPETSISASVLIDCQPNTRLDKRTVDVIRHMVAGERIGLQPSNVTVTDLRSRTVYSDETDSWADGGLRQSLEKRQCEETWQQKIMAALSHIRAAKVVVTAHFDPSAANSGDENASTIDQHGRAEKVTRPITRLAVLVNVPSSYYRDLWKSAKGASSKTSYERADVELRKLRSQTEQAIAAMVKTLTSVSAAQTHVTVTSFDDLAVDSLPPARGSAAHLSKTRLAAATVLAAAVAGIVFRVVLSIKTRLAHGNDGVAVEPPSLNADSAHRSGEYDEAGSVSSSDANLRQQLAEAVRRDPQAAAKVLEKWMRQAG